MNRRVPPKAQGQVVVWLLHCSYAEVQREGHGPALSACSVQPSEPREVRAGERRLQDEVICPSSPRRILAPGRVTQTRSWPVAAQ